MGSTLADVSNRKLLDLLAEQTEWDELDYKSQFRSDTTRAWVELAKDVAAMQIDGGYLIFGVDEAGVPTGLLTECNAGALDEANVRTKLRKWIPEPFYLRSSRHIVKTAHVVLVYVAPNPDGFCILKADGSDGEKQVFKAGDVYARHGSISERWQQSDIRRIRARLREESERECRAKAHEVVVPKSERIAGQAEGMLRDLAEAAGDRNIDPDSVTFATLETWCKAINPNGKAPLILKLESGYANANWMTCLWHWRQRSRQFFMDISPFFPHLDAEHIAMLSRVEQCSYFAQLENLRGQTIANGNISWLATSMWQYLQLVRELKVYVKTRLAPPESAPDEADGSE